MTAPRPTPLPFMPDGPAPGGWSRTLANPDPDDGVSPAPGQARTPRLDQADRPDLGGDADLHGVLETFYAALGRDPLLAPYFATLDLAAHLPRIVDFWSALLFRTGRYDGNVFRPHLAMPGLAARHFARWLAALDAAVRASHAGPTADRMLDLAHRIAYSMQLRLGVTPGEPVDGPTHDPPAAPGGPPC